MWKTIRLVLHGLLDVSLVTAICLLAMDKPDGSWFLVAGGSISFLSLFLPMKHELTRLDIVTAFLGGLVLAFGFFGLVQGY